MQLLPVIYPVIMSGGAGTRLWPVSREAHPKPFMKLNGPHSLLQQTFMRAAALPGAEQVLTVTNKEHYFKSADEFATVNPSKMPIRYLLEPTGRNTAPAVAAAALALSRAVGEDAIMLVLAADHVITKPLEFGNAVSRAVSLASSGHLVTFGITPSHAETGYGYIECDDERPLREEGSFRAKRFVEKPNKEMAERYLSNGKFLWNSGMFCFKADSILEAFERYAPEVLQAVKAAMPEGDDTRLSLDSDNFARVPNISIDYAIMEKAPNVAVVAASIGWSDVGSWDAVAGLAASDEVGQADARGNTTTGHVILQDADNCHVRSDNRVVGVIGVQDLVIVDTDDALLVTTRERSQDVKNIVGELKAANHEVYKLHNTVHRPWGTYTILEEGPGFKTKRIVVKPGASLSLQMHHHRSEHWVVIKGTAHVVNGEQELVIGQSQSTFIPAGNKHRLENPGTEDLVIIEVQCGAYLGEDDIVRFQDVYGRVA
ncbi:mannose-1-phosphate guanylyltransferase/mannose-6-phosphate isomerase [bacterium]|nr:mannose-1-phosphate guanylyltransferase/mannose-6-phosphate isomerase [bacterium]